MGRTPDPPGLQEAKGNPGKRRGEAKKRADAQAKVAQLLAAAPAGDLAAPPMLEDPRLAGALAVWRVLAPELMRTHRLPKESRQIFVQLCVYQAEWLEAQLDIADKGYTQRVKTVAGGFMERRRPMIDRRERAFDNVLKLSERFGLTPHDLYALFKDQAVVAATNPGLFDQVKGPAAAEAEAPAPARSGGLLGAAARLKSTPPGTRPN